MTRGDGEHTVHILLDQLWYKDIVKVDLLEHSLYTDMD